jgi:hypothetical protein
VQLREIKCGKGKTEPTEDSICFDENGSDNHEPWEGFLVHNGIMSALKAVKFSSDRMSYIILRGRWCDVIILFRTCISQQRVKLR